MNKNTHPPLLTPSSISSLQQRLERKRMEYDDLRAQRQVAFELSGDGWHDNPEFNRAQQMEANCNHEIKRLQDVLSTGRRVEVVDGQRPTHAVDVGSVVTFVRWFADGAGPEETWEIGGYGDSDPAQRRVSYDAPLGAALFGLMVGDYAENVPLGERPLDLEIIALHERKKH